MKKIILVVSILFVLIFSGCSGNDLSTSNKQINDNGQQNNVDNNNIFTEKIIKGISEINCNKNLLIRCSNSDFGISDNGEINFAFTYIRTSQLFINNSKLILNQPKTSCELKDIKNMDTLVSLKNSKVMMINGQLIKVSFKCNNLDNSFKDNLDGEVFLNLYSSRTEILNIQKIILSSNKKEKELNLDFFPKEIGDYKIDLNSYKKIKESYKFEKIYYSFNYINKKDSSKIITISFITFNNKYENILSDFNNDKSSFKLDSGIIFRGRTELLIPKNIDIGEILIEPSLSFFKDLDPMNIKDTEKFVKAYIDFSKNNEISKYFISNFKLDFNILNKIQIFNSSEYVDYFLKINNYQKDLKVNKTDFKLNPLQVSGLYGNKIYIKNNLEKEIKIDSLQILSNGKLVCDELRNITLTELNNNQLELNNCEIKKSNKYLISIQSEKGIQNKELTAMRSSSKSKLEMMSLVGKTLKIKNIGFIEVNITKIELLNPKKSVITCSTYLNKNLKPNEIGEIYFPDYCEIKKGNQTVIVQTLDEGIFSKIFNII